MIARIQLRRDSSGNWTLNDPILSLGEIGYETDTEKFKVGDGVSNWSNLNYELGQWKSDSSGNITYGAQAGEGDVFIQNSLVVTGDLTVNGTTTTINTEEVTIEDNMVLLNSNLAIAPPSTLESGIEVNLGTSGSTKLYWDQATLKWTVEGDLNVEGDIYSNNIALWRLNGNDIYFQGGDVGIGIDTPNTTLHIKSTAPIITLEDESDPAWIWEVGQNSDKFFINTETVADGSMFTILNNGKVGIGETNPVAPLHVDSSTGNLVAKFSSSDEDAYISFEDDGTTTPPLVGANDNDLLLWTNNQKRVTIDSSGKVGIGTSAPSAKLTVNKGDDIGFIVQDNTTDNHRLHMMTSASDNGYYIGYASGQSEGYKLNSSGDSYFLGGDVGIGTNSPQTILHLKDITPTSDNVCLRMENDAQVWDLCNRGFDDDKFTIYDVTADNVPFKIEKSSPTNSFYIKSDGRVGIGTSSPDANLAVCDPGTYAAGKGGQINFNGPWSGTSTTSFAYIKGYKENNTSGQNGGKLALGTRPNAGNLTERMTIDSSGNVGIGETSPTSKLDIGLTSSFNKISGKYIDYRGVGNGTNDGYLLLIPAHITGTTSVKSFVGSILANRGSTANGNESMLAKINVSAAYTNNEGVLELFGNADHYFSKLTIVTFSGVDYIAAYFKQTGGGPANGIFVEDAIVAGLDSNCLTMKLGSEVTVVDSDFGSIVSNISGKVGIGTSLPAEKLDVDGNIKVYGGIISLDSNWNVWLDGSSGTSFQINDSTGLNTTFESGKVGIGYSGADSNSEKLQVAGAIKIGNTTTNNAGTIRWSGSDFEGNVNGTWTSLTSGGVVSSQWTTSGSDIYYNTGNVGVGTNNPGAKMDIGIGSSNALGLRVTSSNDAAVTGDHISASTLRGDTSAYNLLKLTNSTGTKFIVQGDGKVGIGAPSPSEKLELMSTSGDNFIKITDTSTNQGSTNEIGIIFEKTHTNLYDFKILNYQDSLYFWYRQNSGDPWNTAYGYIPSLNLHAFSGDITATGTITSTSDISVKENIELISDPIEKVKELSGYTFNKKGEDLRMVGLIAQEVEKVLPEAVHENQEGLKSVAYGNMVALLVECIKKQDERIETLEKTIEKLK